MKSPSPLRFTLFFRFPVWKQFNHRLSRYHKKTFKREESTKYEQNSTVIGKLSFKLQLNYTEFKINSGFSIFSENSQPSVAWSEKIFMENIAAEK